MLTNALRPSSNFKLCTPPSVTQKSTSSPCSLHDHSSSLPCVRDLCVERRVEQHTIEAVVLQTDRFSCQWIPTSLQILRVAALVMVASWRLGLLRLASRSRESGRRSGSCHHDLRHPWLLARRHDSICGSAGQSAPQASLASH